MQALDDKFALCKEISSLICVVFFRGAKSLHARVFALQHDLQSYNFSCFTLLSWILLCANGLFYVSL